MRVLQFVKQEEEFDCGYACLEMLTGIKEKGKPISVNLMKKLLIEKTGENWEIHGTKKDDENEEPEIIPSIFHEDPTFYLVTDMFEPFMVSAPFMAHWIIIYHLNVYDPSLDNITPISNYNKFSLRKIKKY
jgi:hypothetical protein